MTSEQTGAVQLTAAMVLSGTIGVFVVESTASPSTVVLFRCLFGALALAGYALVRGYFRDHGLTRRTVGLSALGGVFIVLNWVFLFSAYEHGSISLATVVYHTQPFFLVLLGAVVLRERLTRGQFGWLAVAFGGLVLVSGVGPGASASVAGVGFALLAALLYAASTLVTKRITGVRPHLVALVQVLVGLPLLLPLAELAEVGGLGAGWAWLVGLGVLHTGVMYVLMYAAYQRLTTARIAVLAFVYPVVALVADRVVYGHHIGLLQALGIPLIVAASLRVNRPKPKPKPGKPKSKPGTPEPGSKPGSPDPAPVPGTAAASRR
ncbi:DMT family transporter [Streptomyces sp. NPDC020875]|uniref:DMT family transporter n=1 Tax=Streptomyces sp. NPDC020875 TaxID=3154898 RepID=UPI003411120D